MIHIIGAAEALEGGAACVIYLSMHIFLAGIFAFRGLTNHRDISGAGHEPERFSVARFRRREVRYGTVAVYGKAVGTVLLYDTHPVYGISACSTAPVETHLSSSRRVCLQSFRWPQPPARPMAAPRAQSRPAPRLRRPCAAPAWAPCRRHRRQHRWRSRRARAPASAGEGTGVQLAPRELQGCVLCPRSTWVKEWLRVGRKGGKAASLRGWGGRSPLTEVLAELVGGAFARDEDDPAEGGVAPH